MTSALALAPTRTPPTLRVPKTRPCSSGGMFVLMENAAQAITSTDVEVCDRGWVGDRFGQWV
jgi:hypothetical protein